MTCVTQGITDAVNGADKFTAKLTAQMMHMLKAGSGIGDMTPAEIAKNDLKEFQIGDYRVIVSQISVMQKYAPIEKV